MKAANRDTGAGNHESDPNGLSADVARLDFDSEQPALSYFREPTATLRSILNKILIRTPSLQWASDLHQEATEARERGDYATAERLWFEALVIKDFLGGGWAAVTENALGELYIRMGRYDDAEKMLKQALSVREIGASFELAETRENLAKLYEHKRDMALARRTRVSNPSMMVCGNYDCPKLPTMPLKLSDFKACSACKSIFYCSKDCQAADWKLRHKALCKRVPS